MIRGRVTLWIRVVLFVVAPFLGWVLLAMHPGPLFPYELQRRNVVLHARAPLPPRAESILEEALRRIERSPLYDERSTHHVFLCDSQAMFDVLTVASRGAALTNPWGNVFLRPTDVEHDRVFGRDGRAKPEERGLTYYIAHELTHAMTFDRYGWWHARKLAAFQREGYADYIAFARRRDLASEREALRRGDPAMDPKRSGLYRRYELLVAYLLERRGWDVRALLSRRREPRAVERELEADRGLSN